MTNLSGSHPTSGYNREHRRGSSIMQRVDTSEILDSEECPAHEAQASLRDLCRINRWFGGVTTTQWMVHHVARLRNLQRMSMLDVAAGFGEVSHITAQKLPRRGINVQVTCVDLKFSHLRNGNPNASPCIVADALQLPFQNRAFDVVGCNLFAHHLEPQALGRFVQEALRVTRHAVLINDLLRHPLHLALVYAGFPLMRSQVSRVDGVASVKRAYVPSEVREIISKTFPAGNAPRMEISHHYLFRMGIIVWKDGNNARGK